MKLTPAFCRSTQSHAYKNTCEKSSLCNPLHPQAFYQRMALCGLQLPIWAKKPLEILSSTQKKGKFEQTKKQKEMALEKDIMSEIKSAMKAKDKTALEALRAVKSAILMAKTDGSGAELSDADEIAILQKQIKMRKDAAQQFQEQGRDEMAENERKQATVIERFLPEQLSREEIKTEIVAIIQKTGATSIKDMGKVMGMANKNLAGKADGKTIADIVKEQLNA